MDRSAAGSPYSEETAGAVDDEVARIIRECYEEA
jgi:ATP-dependent Zn protease